MRKALTEKELVCHVNLVSELVFCIVIHLYYHNCWRFCKLTVQDSLNKLWKLIFILSYTFQSINNFIIIVSITIFICINKNICISLRFALQILEHSPYNNPGRLIIIEAWFKQRFEDSNGDIGNVTDNGNIEPGETSFTSSDSSESDCCWD